MAASGVLGLFLTIGGVLGGTLGCGGGSGGSSDGPALDARRRDASAADGSAPVVDAMLTDAALDAAPPRPDAAGSTPAGMLAWACTGGTCSAGRAVEYWRARWGTYAIKRLVVLTEGTGGVLEMKVTEADGTTPATLEFEVGRPVDLKIVNRAANVEPHTFTAPRMFRAVAWRHAETGAPGVPPGAFYRGPTFDAFQLGRSAAADHIVTLRFIPWTAGTYDAFCETGVPGGTSYPDLADGILVPDLVSAAGHAGRGMKAMVTFTGDLGLPLDPEIDPDRVTSLDRDPRRLDSDPAWLDGTRVDVSFETHEYGLNDYEYLPSDVPLLRDRAHKITVTNALASLEDHYFASVGLLPLGVFSRADDGRVTVRAPYLPAAGLKPGTVMTYFWVALAPAGVYRVFCENGVDFYPSDHPMAGLPNLFTGHAGAGVDPHVGMKGTMTVAPP